MGKMIQKFNGGGVVMENVHAGNTPAGCKNKVMVKLNDVGMTPLAMGMFILLGFMPIIISDQYFIHLMISSLMFGTLAMGFDLSAGYINVANFGYAAFMGIGAYTSALLSQRLGVSPWIGMAAGGILAAFLGFLTGILTLRLRGMFAAILAWFLGMTLLSLANVWVSLTRGSLGLNVDILFDTPEKAPFYYVIFAICLATYMLLKWITNSEMGLAFMAIGQDQEAAESSGINPTKFKVINFTVSCAIAGVVGGFYAHFMGILTPDVMHTKHAMEILVLAYIGGRGSIWGGLLAAIVIIPVFENMKFMMEFRLVVYGLLLILVMIFYPGGMAQFYDTVMVSFKKKKTI